MKISLVSYLNTQPFLYGLLRHPVSGLLDIHRDIPSKGANQLITGEVDLGLVPVASILSLDRALIHTSYCIGSVGPVRTVCLFSDVPIEEITHIYLDYQSRTSVQLVQILCREHWNIQPEFIQAPPGYEKQISGTQAGVIIGDRVIKYEDQFEFNYDLSKAWMDLSGLPFVFAAWISTRPISSDIIQGLNEAFQLGMEEIDAVIAESAPHYPEFDVESYLKENISYTLDDAKREALKCFLEKINCPLKPQFV